MEVGGGALLAVGWCIDVHAFLVATHIPIPNLFQCFIYNNETNKKICMKEEEYYIFALISDANRIEWNITHIFYIVPTRIIQHCICKYFGSLHVCK